MAMKLILPEEVRILRASYPDKSKGLWHLMKGDSMAHCNKYFPDLKVTEESTLNKCREGDVCTICWPWRYEIVEAK